MNGRNYQRELDRLLGALREEGRTPSLLLHACCAPCSSYVLEYLSAYFYITVLFYNPNIHPPSEYDRRVREEERLIREMPSVHPVDFLAGAYEPDEFYGAVRGFEGEPEGGARCERCYRLRLGRAAEAAREGGFDYFTTSLTVSPLKPADRLNRIGGELAEEYGVPYLYSDFKKKDGYRRSVRLSAEYGLYRQNYCGCVFSEPPGAVRADSPSPRRREEAHHTGGRDHDQQERNRCESVRSSSETCRRAEPDGHEIQEQCDH